MKYVLISPMLFGIEKNILSGYHMLRILMKRTFLLRLVLVHRLSDAVIFSKFNMKSGFWQVQISETDKYKTFFSIPFGHYEWNIMPFDLKNASSEFQNIMNDIFNSFSHFPIVYIDDVLVYSKSINEHQKHLYSFLDVIKHNGLVVSAKKSNYFKQRFVSLAIIFLRDKFVPSTELSNLLTNSPMSLLKKHNCKDSLGL